MDFRAQVEKYFKEATDRYHLRVVPFHDSKVFLAGSDYAVSITWSRDGIDVWYYELTAKGAFVHYCIDDMITKFRFSAEDNKHYGNPGNTLDDRNCALLRVVASRLTNRCGDILSGDRAWLGVLRDKDRASWEGWFVNPIGPIGIFSDYVINPVRSDFRTKSEKYLRRVINRYKLHAVPLGPSEMFLAGMDFAVSLVLVGESVDIRYYEYNSRGMLLYHSIRKMLAEQGLLEESFLHYCIRDMLTEYRFFPGVFRHADPAEKRLCAELRVVASGLEKCKDILSGDKAWLRALRKKEPLAWKGSIVNPIDLIALSKGVV
ncbi:MAG: hypothetical protein LBM17_08035 [Candidatus Accumulibacter sp.]|jgi:hypothetical protein|nr:hypothetical protein [Accumulibacter sp.]